MGLVELTQLGNLVVMNIKNYTSFFHDGSINEINHGENKITISMESAEIDREDLKDNTDLADLATILRTPRR